MAMPHLVFKRKCINELKNLSGSAKIERIENILIEMAQYKSGPYADIRKWLYGQKEKAKTVSKTKARDIFAIKKQGDIQVVFIGKPSAGKSSLISALSTKKLETAEYEFTTLKPEAVTIHYKGIGIQLVDLPGLIENASMGKGLGKRIIAAARNADLYILVHDLTKEFSESEIVIQEMKKSGVNVLDRLIVVANKMDKSDSILEIDSPCVYVSALKEKNLELLKDKIIELSGFITVISLVDCAIIPLKKDSTVKDFCKKIHKDLLKEFKHAKVCGKSVKFDNQKVGLKHKLEDGDKIEIVKKN